MVQQKNVKAYIVTQLTGYYAKTFHCDLHIVVREKMLDPAHSGRHSAEFLVFFLMQLK